jgi:hypothetical protein
MKIYRIAKLSIYQIAKMVRQKEVASLSNLSLSDKCLHASRALNQALLDNGYQTSTVVFGTFQLDMPIDDKDKGEIDPSLFQTEEQIQESYLNPEHFWVKVEGLIVDISASQFQDKVKDSIPEIVMINALSKSRYREISEEWT